jgi:serine/threonine-protein kinase
VGALLLFLSAVKRALAAPWRQRHGPARSGIQMDNSGPETTSLTPASFGAVPASWIGIIVFATVGFSVATGALALGHRLRQTYSTSPVPGVVGLSQRLANVRLEAAGFVVRAGATVPSSTVPSGQVLGTSPPAGTLLRKGSTVTLRVSIGRARRILVPSVVGLSQAVATVRLHAAGFGAEIGPAHDSPSVPSGFVIGTVPGPGEREPVGTLVVIALSTGQTDGIRVPAVPGLSPETADIKLRSLGFAVRTGSDQASRAIRWGLVIGTLPPAGSVEPTGTEITLVLSSGTATHSRSVPSVAGESQSAATTTLENAGFAVQIGPATPSPAATSSRPAPPPARANRSAAP